MKVECLMKRSISSDKPDDLGVESSSRSMKPLLSSGQSLGVFAMIFSKSGSFDTKSLSFGVVPFMDSFAVSSCADWVTDSSDAETSSRTSELSSFSRASAGCAFSFLFFSKNLEGITRSVQGFQIWHYPLHLSCF